VTTYAVATPSRGLVHSRTVEAVLANIRVAGFRGWALTHDLPIPQAHERVCEIALATGADAVWLVEEDMIPPPLALAESLRLLGSGADVVAVDYPAARDLSSIARRGGDIQWCFLGCTLVHRRVFETFVRPWFTTDTTYVIRDGELVALPDDRPPEVRHGQQDIAFTRRVLESGFSIAEVPGLVAGHATVDELGAPVVNHGWHHIRVRHEIRGQQL
jgi:hypothetical protein